MLVHQHNGHGMMVIINQFPYFSTKTHVVGTKKSRINETVPLSTQSKCKN